MKNTRTGRILAGAATAALMGSTFLSAGAAQAQEAAEPFYLGELIITARKQSENLQDAAISVTVQTADDLGTGATDTVRDLDKSVPNVTSFSAGGPSFVIRGVGGQALQGLNNEMGVGVFLDDVYVGRIFGVPTYLDDLQRAEVVRGSQATLYGKNTIGGAVNLITTEPDDIAGGQAELSYGTDNYKRVRLGLDQPLADGDILTRTFLSYTKRDGSVKNIFDGADISNVDALSGRFTAATTLDTGTDLKFTVDYERIDDDGQGPWATVDLALDHETALDLPSERDVKRGGVSVRVDHEFDTFALTSITAYRAHDYYYYLDGDFTAGPYDYVNTAPFQQGQDEEQWQVSQEVRISSLNPEGPAQAGDLRWKAGFFAMYEEFEGVQFYDYLNFAPGAPAIPVSDLSSNSLESDAVSLSLFADVAYQITDQLEINGGLRYTYERKTGDVVVTNPFGTFAFGDAGEASGSETYTNLSPELGLSYKMDEDTLFYGKVTGGFKSGGISQFLEPDGSGGFQLNNYDPETAWTYEIGLKKSWLDNRVRLNANAFYVQWKDQQSNIFLTALQRVTANASEATSKGLEVELAAQANEYLAINASYGYLDSTYDDFLFKGREGFSVVEKNFSGNDIPYAPKHTASLGFDWQSPVNDTLDFVANGIVTYRSSHSFDPEGIYRQDPTTTVDLSLGLQSGSWEARLWARNLTDKKYLTEYFRSGSDDVGIAAPGRTIGATFSTQW